MVIHGKNIEVCSFACVGTQVIGQKCENQNLHQKHNKHPHNNNNNNNVWITQVPERRNAV